jgi:hypothetical protein
MQKVPIVHTRLPAAGPRVDATLVAAAAPRATRAHPTDPSGGLHIAPMARIHPVRPSARRRRHCLHLPRHPGTPRPWCHPSQSCPRRRPSGGRSGRQAGGAQPRPGTRSAFSQHCCFTTYKVLLLRSELPQSSLFFLASIGFYVGWNCDFEDVGVIFMLSCLGFHTSWMYLDCYVHWFCVSILVRISFYVWLNYLTGR